MVRAVAVPLKKAEQVRKKLAALRLIDFGYVPKRTKKAVYFAVTKAPPGMRPLNVPLQKTQRKPRNLREALARLLSEDELTQLVKSFDMIGSLAVIEIPKELTKREKAIAKALMSVHPNLKTVAKRAGPFRGKFRVRPLKVIAGSKKTETECKEGGLRYLVDPAKMYYSPRLASERARIASQVMRDERIIVLFAGVGPYAIAMARQRPTAEILAVELNPAAFRYLKRNIKLNGAWNVIPILRDAAQVLRFYPGWADRIVMPLPHSAHEFLEAAIRAAATKGTIHFYSFGPESAPYERALEHIQQAAKKADRHVHILYKGHVIDYAPRTVETVIDFRVD